MADEKLNQTPTDLAPAPADPASFLMERESQAYVRFLATMRQGGSPTFPIAPEAAAGLFELFLQGRELEDIRRLHPTLSLGQIAYAAVDGRWHERRAAHLDELLGRTQHRVLQVQLEGAEFSADALAATHRVERKKLEEALAAGEGDSGFIARTPQQYKQLVDNLRTVTGQDAKVQRGGERPPDAPPIPRPVVPAQDQVMKPGARLAELAAIQKQKKARSR